MSLRSDLLLAVATLACCASALQGNGPATRVITEPAISRHALPLGAAEPAISRRALMLGAAAAALLPGPHRATAANELPPAVVMLRVAEVMFGDGFACCCEALRLTLSAAASVQERKSPTQTARRG